MSEGGGVFWEIYKKRIMKRKKKWKEVFIFVVGINIDIGLEAKIGVYRLAKIGVERRRRRRKPYIGEVNCGLLILVFVGFKRLELVS